MTHHKFLFQGAPGTGKTEAVKQLARIFEREIYMVDFSLLIDSKLGQTQKNISTMFKEINNFTIKYHDRIVGILAETKDGKGAFQYDKSWLVDGFSISPLKDILESYA